MGKRKSQLTSEYFMKDDSKDGNSNQRKDGNDDKKDDPAILPLLFVQQYFTLHPQ
jgi:hypothetical protein